MVFSSLPFLFVFLPVFLIVYYLLPDRFRNLWLFAASLGFYAYGIREHPLYFLLFLLQILVGWECGRQMRHARSRKAWLILGVTVNFGMLFFFKYAGFLAQACNGVLQTFTSLRLPEFYPELPIGISFYTFQITSYLFDIYRRTVHPTRSLIRFGAYASMFPQLIAGPIVTYSTVAQSLRRREHTFAAFDRGLMEFTLGLGSKVILANRIGGLWNAAEKIGFESISTPLAWAAILAYTLQIYYDFYGYSLMAVGLGRMLGFELPQNFLHPYSAVSITDFWRRWHVTLGAWFREYIYIPLGGNREGTGKTVRNLLIVWLLTGIWHGAGWNFLLWGLMWFVLLTAEKFLYGKKLEKHRALGHLYLWIVIPLAWVPFVLTDLCEIGTFYGRLFPLFSSPAGMFPGDVIKYGLPFLPWIAAGIVCLTSLPRRFLNCRVKILPKIALALVFWCAVLFMVQGLDDPFMYFRF